MITLMLCKVSAVVAPNPGLRPAYLLFRPEDAPDEGRIATVTGTFITSGPQRIQLTEEEPIQGDVLPYNDGFIEVHKVH